MGGAHKPLSEGTAAVGLSVRSAELGLGEDGLGSRKLIGPDHLDVGLARLQQHGLAALVLPIDELGRAVRHEVISPGAGLQGSDDLFLVGSAGTLQSVGIELDRVVAAVDLEGKQGAFVGCALAQIGRFG